MYLLRNMQLYFSIVLLMKLNWPLLSFNKYFYHPKFKGKYERLVVSSLNGRSMFFIKKILENKCKHLYNKNIHLHNLKNNFKSYMYYVYVICIKAYFLGVNA